MNAGPNALSDRVSWTRVVGRIYHHGAPAWPQNVMQITVPKKASPSEQDPDDMPSDSATTMRVWQSFVVRKYGGSLRVVFAFPDDTTQAGSLNRPEWSYACVSVLHASNLTDASS